MKQGVPRNLKVLPIAHGLAIPLFGMTWTNSIHLPYYTFAKEKNFGIKLN